MTKSLVVCSLVLAASVVSIYAQPQERNSPKPRYDGQNLLRPENYREWVFLSSGLGMDYNAAAGGDLFTNVFVPQWSYLQFLSTGKWPDKSIFVVEERKSETKGSINKAGRFQTDFVGLGVEVKDESRFPDKWAYFSFPAETRTAAPRPKAACWQCHNDNAAVEHTFVQFYPVLKDVAKKFGTYRTGAEDASPGG